MTARRPRQVRGFFTGGTTEIQEFLQMLQESADQRGWSLTYQTEPERFGDVGPLHRLTYGFTERL